MNEGEGNSVEGALPSVYVAAHELKAPLVLMRQLVLELEASGDASSQTVERLLLTVERSLRLVDQLTKTSRLEDSLFDSEPLQAFAVCQAVATELQPFAEHAEQQIVTRVSRRSGVAVGHRSLLTAVLVNLCDNAIAHNPPGSTVTISAKTSRQGVMFAVRDEGPQVNRRLFHDMRTRLGSGPMALSQRPRSSGLGLWIASRFVAAMGGTMTMTRHIKAGITVTVRLPHSKQLSLV